MAEFEDLGNTAEERVLGVEQQLHLLHTALAEQLELQAEQGQDQWRQLAEMLKRISDVGPAFRGLQEEDNQTMLLTLKTEYNYIRSAARKANAPAVMTMAD
eukprot:gene2268-2580_t